MAPIEESSVADSRTARGGDARGPVAVDEGADLRGDLVLAPGARPGGGDADAAGGARRGGPGEHDRADRLARGGGGRQLAGLRGEARSAARRPASRTASRRRRASSRSGCARRTRRSPRRCRRCRPPRSRPRATTTVAVMPASLVAVSATPAALVTRAVVDVGVGGREHAVHRHRAGAADRQAEAAAEGRREGGADRGDLDRRRAHLEPVVRRVPRDQVRALPDRRRRPLGGRDRVGDLPHQAGPDDVELPAAVQRVLAREPREELRQDRRVAGGVERALVGAGRSWCRRGRRRRRRRGRPR